MLSILFSLCYHLDMVRKLLIPSIMILVIAATSVFGSFSVFAREAPGTTGRDNETKSSSSDSQNDSESGGSTREGGGCQPLLGLTPWYCNVDLDNIDSEEDLSNNIWMIVSNVLKDLIVIAAYLILGYVIYGGYQYIFSGGEPAKIASGKKTLTNGFIGLAIVLMANIFVTAIRVVLGANFSENCFSVECVNPTEMISEAIQWTIAICGLVAAAFIVYGGILYITSSGDPQKTQRAKQTILYALIGIAIVALAELITAFVTNMIKESINGSGSTGYNQVITKEVNEKIN